MHYFVSVYYIKPQQNIFKFMVVMWENVEKGEEYCMKGTVPGLTGT